MNKKSKETSTVFIDKCSKYEVEKIKEIISEAISNFPELVEKIKPGVKVLLKPNLLKKNKPEEAVTTNPAVVEAVAKYFIERGAKVIIADSPGGLYNEGVMKQIYSITGLVAVAERTGAELNFDFGSVEVENKKALKLFKMHVINPIETADIIINIAKLKTHCMMTYTGAVKNLFGVIPGLTKADYHLKMKNERNFAEHLVDICEYVKPDLNIIDGIEGMEGNGPSAGEKRKADMIIVSDNAYSADIAACKAIGIEGIKVPTIEVAKLRMINGADEKNVVYIKKRPEDMDISPFKLPDSSVSITFVGGRVPKFVEDFVLERLRPKPAIIKSKCIKCGVCAEVCPAKTIKIIEKNTDYPEIELSECIRCFCCHELCPKKAIEIKKNLIYEAILGGKK